MKRGRLVTLTGVGGSGKTRLALEVGTRTVAGFPGGVWLVELAPVTDPTQVARAIADVLGIPGQPERDLVDVLGDALASRAAALLVLDNCEHVAGACAALVTRLLGRAAHLRVLATSRQPLSLPGEAVWPLPPLDIDTDAVALFRDRARLARPDLPAGTGAEDRQVVTDICRRLDGLPLAIELAAAQVQAFSPADIAARLGDRFRLLQRPSPDFDRHRSLRATISWSHDLLSPGARIVLRRLAAFAGSFDLSAAEEVCAGPDLDATDIPARLGELVSNSLVARDASGRPERYRLLETVRAYAEEQLDEAGERGLAGSAHSAWCLQLGQAASPHIPGPDEVVWRRRLDVEVHELRAALAFDLANQPGHGLRLALALSRYWLMWDRADEVSRPCPPYCWQLRRKASTCGPGPWWPQRSWAPITARPGRAPSGRRKLSICTTRSVTRTARRWPVARSASAQQNRGNLERAARLLETSSEYFEAEDRTVRHGPCRVRGSRFVETQCGEYERAGASGPPGPARMGPDRKSLRSGQGAVDARQHRPISG